jgi:hypothetical protein
MSATPLLGPIGWWGSICGCADATPLYNHERYHCGVCQLTSKYSICQPMLQMREFTCCAVIQAIEADWMPASSSRFFDRRALIHPMEFYRLENEKARICQCSRFNQWACYFYGLLYEVRGTALSRLSVNFRVKSAIRSIAIVAKHVCLFLPLRINLALFFRSIRALRSRRRYLNTFLFSIWYDLRS